MLRTGTSLCSNEVLYSWTVFERHWRETQTFWTYTSIRRLVDVLHCSLFIWRDGYQGRLQDYIRGGGGEEGKQGEGGSGCSEWFFFASFSPLLFWGREILHKAQIWKKNLLPFLHFFGLMNFVPGCEDGDQEPCSGELKTQQYHKLALLDISDYCLLNRGGAKNA